ncbi:AAA family ATPase [bacterium]|nr:AAA family ATPase [bacterium]
MKFIIHLIGYPAAGKLTIAKELAKDNDFKIFDNHTVNNVLFCLTDITTTLPKCKGKYIDKIYKIAFKYFKKIGVKENIIFTTFLEEEKDDIKFYKLVNKFAKQINHLYIPIILTPTEETLLSRVVNKERAEKMKLTDTEIAKQIYQRQLINMKNKYKLEIDNSNLSPLQTKEIILKHIETICQNKY